MSSFNQQHPGKTGPGRGAVLAAVAAALVLAGAGLWYLGTAPDAGPESMAQTQPGTTTSEDITGEPSMSREELENLSHAEVATQQQQAMAAIAETVGSGPVSGPLKQRPEFVSQVEWTVFQHVAGQHPEPDQELVNLVNRLRFHKQKELWETLEGSDHQVQRAALAEQLLEEIPWHLQNQVLDRNAAHNLQLKILRAHITDPRERNRRAAREAERIGVTFEIGNS